MVTRRNLLAGGVGISILGGASRLLNIPRESPRAWRVSFVDCDEPIVKGYDGEQFYATLIRSRAEARERFVETECFGPNIQQYLSLDYSEFVVSVRTAVLPTDKRLQTVSYEFAEDTLKHVVRVADVEDEAKATQGMRHVVTTWELNGAKSPERVQLKVEDSDQ